MLYHRHCKVSAGAAEEAAARAEEERYMVSIIFQGEGAEERMRKGEGRREKRRGGRGSWW